MFRHKLCHPQGAFFVNLPNYVSTIATLARINKIFKTLKLSSVIKWFFYMKPVWLPYIQSVTNIGFINI